MAEKQESRSTLPDAAASRQIAKNNTLNMAAGVVPASAAMICKKMNR
ncbi:hypothetical protein [Phyllobacterium sp.]|nr:hypothetical protein [Phyllobacterium sp.]